CGAVVLLGDDGRVGDPVKFYRIFCRRIGGGIVGKFLEFGGQDFVQPLHTVAADPLVFYPGRNSGGSRLILRVGSVTPKKDQKEKVYFFQTRSFILRQGSSCLAI